MKIIQIIKRLNNTELGKGNTHETYVRLNNDADGNLIFNNLNELEFVNKRNGKNIILTYTHGREQRFNGLGEFYRENDILAGDEVIFERKIFDDYEEYYIDFLKFSDNVVLQKTSSIGFEILKGDWSVLFEDVDELNNISIEYLGEFKKRSDSPNYTKYYDILIDKRSVLKKYKPNDMIEIKNNNGIISLLLINPCIIYEMDV